MCSLHALLRLHLCFKFCLLQFDMSYAGSVHHKYPLPTVDAVTAASVPPQRAAVKGGAAPKRKPIMNCWSSTAGVDFH